MFHSVGSRVNLPQIEEKILAFWRDNDTFARSVEARRGGDRFVLYDGPPTTNGKPGIHHVLARVFKDIIPRYQTMKGRYAPRTAGWDTHGLPVELEVEKSLGLKSKKDIEEYGIDRFNARCRKSVHGYLKEWEELTERIGFWIDQENAYVTMDSSYMESVWWAIKRMWDEGLVYQGYRVTPHCPRCGTSLSSHEVALGYKDDTEDPSVYIKFKIDPISLEGGALAEHRGEFAAKPAYLLAWTTTPWTLPGNTALAVAPDAEYVLMEGYDSYIILAHTRREGVDLEDYQEESRFKGDKLIGVRYQPLYNPHDYGVDRQRFSNGLLEPQPQDEALSYAVIGGDFVTMDEGTGIVHVAPAYGEVDYQAGEDSGLDFVHPIALQGTVRGAYPGAGKFVKEADKDIMADLESRGLLYKGETVWHTYPFCWRCDSPLLYYAKRTWYIKTTQAKEELISGNGQINWYPEHIKRGRFGDWLQNNVDWAFSRERYWGTPLPMWRCENPDCGHVECVGGVEELKAKSGLEGLKEPLDLHRPFVDDITFSCPECGGRMGRVPEVMDCWFDSGAMPVAQLHYPFENKELFDSELKQADYISEAVDQTRGWFYSLHAISTLLFGRPCFENVICLGHILDAKGEKMSKARGNVVKPRDVIDKYGADALRWYFFTASPAGNVRRFDEKIVAEVARRFLGTLWNVYSFFVTYANIDGFVPQMDKPLKVDTELDRWILSELNQMVESVDGALGGYNPQEGGRHIESFVDRLSNWYVRRSRRRFWKSQSDTDKLQAYNTLYHCLVTLIKLMAPFTPFLAEEIYQNLVLSPMPDAPPSVHLANFPEADKDMIDEQLSRDVRLAMKACSLGRAARAKAGIKVRQPLSCALVKTASAEEVEGLKRLAPQVLEELNVKKLEFAAAEEELAGEGYVAVVEGGCGVAVPTRISDELLAEGLVREVVHRIQGMRRNAGFDIADRITLYYQGGDDFKRVMREYADYIKQETLCVELVDGAPPEDAFAESLKLGGGVVLGVKKAA